MCTTLFISRITSRVWKFTPFPPVSKLRLKREGGGKGTFRFLLILLLRYVLLFLKLFKNWHASELFFIHSAWLNHTCAVRGWGVGSHEVCPSYCVIPSGPEVTMCMHSVLLLLLLTLLLTSVKGLFFTHLSLSLGINLNQHSFGKRGVFKHVKPKWLRRCLVSNTYILV